MIPDYGAKIGRMVRKKGTWKKILPHLTSTLDQLGQTNNFYNLAQIYLMTEELRMILPCFE